MALHSVRVVERQSGKDSPLLNVLEKELIVLGWPLSHQVLARDRRVS
jgi:hypothetical protein